MKPEFEGMDKIADGVYADDKGVMHLDVDELLIAAGWEPTEENKHTLEAVIDTVAGSYGIPVSDYRPEESK